MGSTPQRDFRGGHRPHRGNEGKKMKNTSRIAFAAAVALSAIAAQAGQDFTGDHYPPQVQSQSTLTRAEVINELKLAQEQGTLPNYDVALISPRQEQSSTVTRAQVRAETLATTQTGGLSFGS
jgi:hypothetical protein